MDSTTPDSPALLTTATHIAFDSPAAERLVTLGAGQVVRASDCLLLGPSRRDPALHAQAREAWWRSSEEWDSLESASVRWALPVVLWVSSNIVQRVNLWRACHRLRGRGISASDVHVLDFEAVPPHRPPEEPRASFDCTSSVADCSDDVLLERLAQSHPLSKTHLDRVAKLWEVYTSDDPVPFVRSCLRGVKGFPELSSVWAFLSCLFPRKTPAGALRLSRFDELLLDALSSDERRTAVAVLVHKSQAGVELRHLFSCTGDLFIPVRLDQWAAHGPTTAVERAPGPKPPGHPMMSSTYRLTEHGRRLLDDGLGQLSDAPSLPVAGVEAYASSSPWVLLDTGRLARG